MWVRKIPNCVVRSLSMQLRRHNGPTMCCTLQRKICDKPLLKSEMYEKEVKRFRARLTDTDPFWFRVLTMIDEGKVFDEDLKMAWFLAEEEHLSEAVRLTEKYLGDLKVTTAPFKYSSIMMRTCVRLNRPDVALELFQSPIISKHLDDSMSIIILMDLLIKNGKYSEAVNVIDQVQKWEWFFVLRNPVIPLLYTVALYKQGTWENLCKACEILRKIAMRPTYRKRTENLVFHFAIRLKEISVLEECIRRPVSSEVEWNMKIQGLTILSKWTDLLKEMSRKHYRIFQDTHKLIHTMNPNISKNLCHETAPQMVEDQLLLPVTLEEFKDVLTETKKKFYL